jgi:hypothetical protein
MSCRLSSLLVDRCKIGVKQLHEETKCYESVDEGNEEEENKKAPLKKHKAASKSE